MSQQIISTALYLPTPEIEALIQGRTIAAVPRRLLRPAERFALCPVDFSTITLPIARYYRQTYLTQNSSETLEIKAWGKCEFCQVVDGTKSLEKLSQITVWTIEGLQEMLRERRNIFLAYLRVYLLTPPFEMSPDSSIEEKIGKFVSLPNSLPVSESSPVLSDSIFAQRRYQLENRIPPLHPELEELQSQIAQIAITNSNAKQLDEDIKIFLGWAKVCNTPQFDSDFAWIQTIANVGNSSDGSSFEKLVRKSLIKLGFTNSNSNPRASLDPESTGGAGGIDVYCEAPYPVVGECKASKNESVPNSVTAQLIHLGVTHLGQRQFDSSMKLIFAAGPLTKAAHKAAVENKMNVMRPETLQSLVELQSQYKNSIDLLELKKCLQQEPFGLADDKIKTYIEKVKQNIKLRSHIVAAVKQLCESDSELPTVAEIKVQYNAKFAAGFNLTDKLVYDLVVELSSPLTGYLGRKKGSDGSDRFYYLRDLVVKDEQK